MSTRTAAAVPEDAVPEDAVPEDMVLFYPRPEEDKHGRHRGHTAQLITMMAALKKYEFFPTLNMIRALGVTRFRGKNLKKAWKMESWVKVDDLEDLNIPLRDVPIPFGEEGVRLLRSGALTVAPLPAPR